MLESNIEKILGNDGVIAFVTDTVWGLGCLPSSQKAVKRIYEIKKRESQKPLILMSHDIYPLLHYVEPIPKAGHLLMKKHFPGALTLVLKKSKNTPDYITSGLDTVGIRAPDNETFRRICKGYVLATTSANLSHQPSAKTYEQTLENLDGLADLVIPDYGHPAKGLESTVAGIFDDEIKIFRQGAVIL
ncbi:MAG: threonylcarbamoyl-AMP synthase [Heliobacteriaceae bacterium]|jgi:L-threonylcarbamoyladenylate synthase|nr:threonylcarbamoyl-AMP synthase [Heliobacteriaceae bacterium]